MTRFLFPLIGYFCVATVISGGLGYFYLRHSGTLNDEKLFQVVALLHNVDLKDERDELKNDTEKIPPEELSYDQQMAQLQGATLHFDVKQKMLATSLATFDSQLERLSLQTNWYTKHKEEVQKFLQEQMDRVTDKSLETVVNHLKGMDPAGQVKPFLLKLVGEKRVDEAIDILAKMAPGVRSDVLLAFDTAEDQKVLYEIYSKILDGGPVKSVLEATKRDLEQRISQEQ